MTSVGLPEARTDVVVLATGGRDWRPLEPVVSAFAAVVDWACETLPGPYRFGLVQGECPMQMVGPPGLKEPASLDWRSVAAARRVGWHVFYREPGVRGFPADWGGPLGKGAGPARNLEMIEFTLRLPAARLCLGFPTPSSRGTWHCMREARRAGIEVWRVREDGSIDREPQIPER